MLHPTIDVERQTLLQILATCQWRLKGDRNKLVEHVTFVGELKANEKHIRVLAVNEMPLTRLNGFLAEI
jgi:hypothetical protein